MGLDGKVAIVTGAARGIGQAIAQRLARDGASVLLADVDAEAVRKAADEITSRGGHTAFNICDVRDAAAVATMFDAAEADFGPVDIVVNNAGIAGPVAIVDETVEHWDHLFAVNARGVFLGVQQAAQRMIPRKSGCIINLASAAGKIGRPYLTTYCATKHAVVGITRAAAAELAPHGIRVNALCPGIVETALWKKMDPVLSKLEAHEGASAWEKRVEGIPLGRAETPEDVAGAAAWLASDDASYVTGQSLNVDGGIVMS